MLPTGGVVGSFTLPPFWAKAFAVTSFVPHWLHVIPLFIVRHEGQTISSVPHWSQNQLSSSMSCLHFGHVCIGWSVVLFSLYNRYSYVLVIYCANIMFFIHLSAHNAEKVYLCNMICSTFAWLWFLILALRSSFSLGFSPSALALALPPAFWLWLCVLALALRFGFGPAFWLWFCVQALALCPCSKSFLRLRFQSRLKPSLSLVC